LSIRLDSRKTALVLIDLQHGIVSLPVQPLSAAAVVDASRELAAACRRHGATVVYVRVDLANMLPLKVDIAHARDDDAPIPASASELVDNAGFMAGDLIVTKRHWGAFDLSSGLEHALKERDIDTIILAGIATNYGVESTARQANSLGFQVVIASDACSSLDATAHAFTMEKIFPLMARVRSAREIVDALS
jgi:nicotinamidase-related amidase